ncbi:MAG: copper amine oxidase [Clostridia bacterium]|nr:copper amine oxidase [Clostridia bacterium]
MKRKIILPFLAGIIATILIFATAASTGLVSKMIQVFYGVDIYIDDKLLDAKDVNGNPVEAFIYNGTTYLPIRAVGEAVGKTVQWEGKNNSAYLGKHTGDKPAVWLKDLDYFYETGSGFRFSDTLQDNLGNTHNNCISTYSSTLGGDDATYHYIINGQYTKLTGCFFLNYKNRSYNADYKLKIYGDDVLLYEAVVGSGIMPIDFSVDLRGVLKLSVHIDGYPAALGECGLWT